MLISLCQGADFEIREYRGAPALCLDGKPEFALFLFSEEITEFYGKQFSKCGFRFYSCIEPGNFLDLGWKGDHTFDFAHVDKLLSDFSLRVPNGYLLPKVHVWAPQWWTEKYPEELIGFEHKPAEYKFTNGVGPQHESFASLRWKEEAGVGLRLMVRHIMNSSYRDKVMGIFVASGQYGEWHPWHWLPDNTVDTSESMRQAFIKYLGEKYGDDVSRLRDAWNNDDVTFDDVCVPVAADRYAEGVGLFLKKETHQAAIDYQLMSHALVAELIDYFCGIVKEESGGELLTCVQYGYTPDIPWATRDTHHRAGERVLSMESVDIVTAPHSYYFRDLGDPGALRHYLGSLHAHGKLFIDEADERTHLDDPGRMARYADNMEESQSVLWRSFANVVTNGAGLWYMDHFSGKWYDDPAFFELFARVRRCADHAMTLPRESVAEVAVIGSMQSELYLGTTTDLTAQFCVKQRNQLAKCGAPVDWYLIDDLEEGLVPEYKVYIFLDCFYLTDRQRQAIDALKKNGHTLIWFYAPGFVGERGCSLSRMEELTGIDFGLSDEPFDYVELDRDKFPDAPARFRGWRENDFGAVRRLSPRFVVTDGDAKILGHYGDTKQAAVAVKEHERWTSVYVATADLPWQVLREIVADGQVHLYAQSGDSVVVNSSWLGIHAASDGMKKITLPGARPVFDVIADESVGEELREFEVEMKKGETALFVFDQGLSQ